MPRMQYGFLCQSVLAHSDGTSSALGIGIESITVPEFPAAVAFSVVCAFKLEEAEADYPHLVALEIRHGTEVVAKMIFPVPAARWNSLNPPGVTLRQNMAFDARSAGRYDVDVSVDADLLHSQPLTVHSAMPPL